MHVCKVEQALEMLVDTSLYSTIDSRCVKLCVNVHQYLQVHDCKSEQALEMLVNMALYSTTDYRFISSLCLFSLVSYSACLYI